MDRAGVLARQRWLVLLRGDEAERMLRRLVGGEKTPLNLDEKERELFGDSE